MLWARVPAVAVLLAAVACASTRPSPRRSAVLDPVTGDDLIGLALTASGYESNARDAAHEELDRMLQPIVERLAGGPRGPDLARALLAELHLPGGPLGSYDARATSLREILEGRRFNCLSASVLYNLAAARLGLLVSAQLLPTHARSLLGGAGGVPPVVVETTSPQGFDPPPEIEAQILMQVASVRSQADQRVLVPEGGVTVSNRVLIGAIYINRASIAQEAGDLVTAQDLFAKGESLAPDEQMRSVLSAQRAALLSQLAVDDVGSGDPERLLRGWETLAYAASLESVDPEVRQVVLKNLRAAAERLAMLRGEGGDEGSVLEVLQKTAERGLVGKELGGLTAFVMSELARIRLGRGAYEGALEALDTAASQDLPESELGLAEAIRKNRVSILRAAALEAARRGDLAKGMALVEQLLALPELDPGARKSAEEDRKKLFLLAGQKEVEAGKLQSAAEIYRSGFASYPDDGTLRNNLSAALERLALPMVNEGRCEQASKLLLEIGRIDPRSAFVRLARARCLAIRAEARLGRRDFRRAVSLFRAAFEAAPEDSAIRESFALGLARWVESKRSRSICAKALPMARDLSRQAPSTEAAAQALDRVLRRCERR